MTLPLTSFLAGTDSSKTESKTAQAQMLILELLADGKRMPSAELEKTVNERGISSRTMRTAKRPYRGQACDRERRRAGSAISETNNRNKASVAKTARFL